MEVPYQRLGVVALPDFLLVGAAKSATTSLYHYLCQHPGIRMTSLKENWFFSFRDNPPRYASPGVLSHVVSSVEEYVKLFAGAGPEQKLGDASPSYLYTYRDTIRHTQSLYPPPYRKDLRIVISLREPVSRAFSQYWTFRRVANEPLSFEAAIEDSVIQQRMRDNWNIFYDYTGFGRYYEQVKAYLEAFGREQVLIVLYEDIQQDPVAVCQKIFSFIGVDPGFVPDVGMRHNDLTGDPRFKWLLRALKSKNPVKRAITAAVKRFLIACLPEEPTRRAVDNFAKRVFKHRRMEIAPQTRARLAQGFADDVRRLETLIGRDLSHWRNGA
jgi:Sulfotransferase domain